MGRPAAAPAPLAAPTRPPRARAPALPSSPLSVRLFSPSHSPLPSQSLLEHGRSFAVSKETFHKCRVLSRKEIEQSLHWDPREGVWPGISNVWHPASTTIRLWTAWMLLVTLVYVAVVEPIFIAFNTNITSNGTAAVIDFVTGLAFTIDVLVNFRSGVYYLHDGHVRLCLDGRVVAKEYLRRYFVIDFLSAVPFVAQVGFMIWVASTGHPPVVHGLAVTALRVLRLLRVVRLYKLFSSRRAILGAEVLMLQRSGSPLAIFALSVLYWFSFIVNLMACTFIFTATAECFCTSWVAQLAQTPSEETLPGVDTWCGVGGAVCENTGLQLPNSDSIYISSLYFATMTLTTVGYGDIVAKSSAEKLVVIGFMLLGALFVAIFTARIIEILAKHGEARQAEQAFKDKMVDADLFVRDYKLEGVDQEQVMQWVQSAYLPHEKRGMWRSDLLEELPIHMRAAAIAAITDLKQQSFPGVGKEVWTWMVGRMRPVRVHAGHFVAVEGDPVKSLFFTSSGTLAVLSVGSTKTRLTQLRGGGRCVGGEAAAALVRGEVGSEPPTWPHCVEALVESELFELTFESINAALRLGEATEAERAALASTFADRCELAALKNA